jgi:predicted AlkP superfamily pyrophosphatase or phosphodiesterase
MNRYLLLIVVFGVLGATSAGAQDSARAQERSTVAATPTDKSVVIVSIDGARPDLLLRANAPVFRSLLARGSYTMWARTTAVAVTLPSHTSMLTGVEPRKHGIEWNSDLKFAEPVYPRYPTIFELARKVGYSTALVTGKTKFSFLNKPGTIDDASINEGPTVTDKVVAETAARLILEKQPRVMMVHFAKVDTVGHAKGWGTDEQMAAIEEADAALGLVIAAIEKAGKTDRTYVILTADHGGAGLTHGPEDARSRHIPWVIVGPGVRKNYDMARVEAMQVETYDTFATVCELLKIPMVRQTDGKFVAAAMEQVELMGDKK